MMYKNKLLFCFLCLCVLSIANTAFALEEIAERANVVYGDNTASGLIYTGKCTIKNVIINTDGTNNATLLLRDATAASTGATLFRGTCLGASVTCITPLNAECNIGIYGTLTTSGTAYYSVEVLHK